MICLCCGKPIKNKGAASCGWHHSCIKHFFGTTRLPEITISNEALELAKINALDNDVEINFINRDILKDDKYYKYDVVISNPPYIEETETVGISTKYEPQIALFAKDNGLEFYKKILKNYQAKLYAFEIGYKQKDSIIKIAKNIYPKSRIIAKKDYANFDRYIYIINE